MIGRDEELAFLSELISQPEGGAQVVLLGGPGVGKTTLLGALAAHARSGGMRVLQVCGNESESDVAFASVADLLRPLRDGLDTPHRQARCGARRS